VWNLLDNRLKIRMWVSIYDIFVCNLGINKWLNLEDYPLINYCTLSFFLYTCISLCWFKFSPSSIDCNIVVIDIMQTWPIKSLEREFMVTVVFYRPQIYLQHSDRIEYHKNTCVFLAGISHMEMHISSQLITYSVSALQTQLSLVQYYTFSMR